MTLKNKRKHEVNVVNITAFAIIIGYTLIIKSVCWVNYLRGKL